MEDQLRLSPRFTLWLGFRAESTNRWNEAHGRAATFTYGSNGALETNPRISSSTFTINRAKFLPQPRVGFAWSPESENNTVIRGGFGMYNDLQDGLSYRMDQNAPFNTSSPTAPPSVSADVITSTATSSRQMQVAMKLVW